MTALVALGKRDPYILGKVTLTLVWEHPVTGYKQAYLVSSNMYDLEKLLRVETFNFPGQKFGHSCRKWKSVESEDKERIAEAAKVELKKFLTGLGRA